MSLKQIIGKSYMYLKPAVGKHECVCLPTDSESLAPDREPETFHHVLIT